MLHPLEVSSFVLFKSVNLGIANCSFGRRDTKIKLISGLLNCVVKHLRGENVWG